MNKKLRPLATLLFLLGSSGLFAQYDSSERFVFLEYGFPSTNEYIEVRSKIGEKWNIYHKYVAGCMPSERLVDSVRLFNDNTSAKLSEKYGDDWNDRYYDEIEKAFEEYAIARNKLRVDTTTRESKYFVEKLINNPDHTSLFIEIEKKELEKTDYLTLSVKNLQDDSDTIVYRGFRNLFQINLLDSKTSSFHLECINCSIRTEAYGDSLPIQQYYILPKKAKELTLNVYSTTNEPKSFKFSVRNLPDPDIYVNGIRSGNSIDKTDLDTAVHIIARYPDEITLRSQFTVESWEIHIGKNLRLHGNSSEIDEENLESLRSVETGSSASIICIVKGPDGIRRKKAAAFKLN